MKGKQDYIQNIAEIRSMMERSSKFLSLSGLAGIMAGIYALIGAYIAYRILDFNPDEIFYSHTVTGTFSSSLVEVIFLAVFILAMAIGTAIWLSYKKANIRGEKIWNASAKQLLMTMAVPLLAGGILVIVMISHGLFGLIAPVTLIFYGLALFNASKFTYEELKFLGLIQIGLGLISSYFIGFGLLFWALGFGLVHIIYGTYMHYRYER